MDNSLVAPEEFRDFVPGDETLRGDDRLMTGAAIFGYRYDAGEEVIVPPLRDFLVVAHRQPQARLHRVVNGRWCQEDLGEGDISFFARAEESHWRWDDDLDVLHLHLSEAQLLETSRQMYGRDVGEIDLPNLMRSPDPALHRVMVQLAEESAADRVGNELVIDSLLTQLGVLVLRRHARAVVRDAPPRGLTPAQERTVRTYVTDHLSESITLADLAGSVYLSRYHFLRLFRETLHMTPHDFVTEKRVELARRLLTRTSLPIRDVARACGFADQSHLTRVTRKRLGATPGQLRGA